MLLTKMLPTNIFGLNDWFDSLNEDVKSCDTCSPHASVSEKGGIYTLEVELPGVKKSDIDVDVQGNTLSSSRSQKSHIRNQVRTGVQIVRGFESGKYRRLFGRWHSVFQIRQEAERTTAQAGNPVNPKISQRPLANTGGFYFSRMCFRAIAFTI